MKKQEKNGTGRVGQRPYWVWLSSVFVRALHQLGAAVFLGAVLLTHDPVPSFFVLLAYISGGVLFFMEWLRHRQTFRELSGLATVVKVLLIGTAAHGLLSAQPAVTAAFLLASVCSHLPKNYRHRLLF